MLCRNQSAGERAVDEHGKPTSRGRGNQLIAESCGRMPIVCSDADVRPDRVLVGFMQQRSRRKAAAIDYDASFPSAITTSSA
jgi:hypothetical protein